MEDSAETSNDSPHLSSKGWKARHVFHNEGSGSATDSEDSVFSGEKGEETRGQIEGNALNSNDALFRNSFQCPTLSKTKDQVFQECEKGSSNEEGACGGNDQNHHTFRISQSSNPLNLQNQTAASNFGLQFVNSKNTKAGNNQLSDPFNTSSSDESSLCYKYSEVESTLPNNTDTGLEIARLSFSRMDANTSNSEESIYRYNYRDVESAIPIDAVAGNINEFDESSLCYKYSEVESTLPNNTDTGLEIARLSFSRMDANTSNSEESIYRYNYRDIKSAIPIDAVAGNINEFDESSLCYKYSEVESTLPNNTDTGLEIARLSFSRMDANTSNSEESIYRYNYRDIKSAIPVDVVAGNINEQLRVPWTDSYISSADKSSFYLDSSALETLYKTDCQPYAVQENPYMHVINSLNASARCEESDCDDADCKQIKKLLFEIEEHWKAFSKPLTDVHNAVLMSMYEHFKSCQSRQCLFPWCCAQLCKSLQDKNTREQIITHLCRWIASSVAEANLGPQISLEIFIKFDHQIEFDSAPREGQAWSTLCRMGRFSKASLAKPNSTFTTGPGQLWVLKRQVNQTKADAWEIYLQLAKLRDLQTITPLLWAARPTDSYDDFIVCSALEGICLQEHLQSGEYLTSELVVKIMIKLVVALQHLQSVQIVYLNWTSKNILIHKNLTGDICVKVINFDSSTIVGKVVDVSVLPTHLLPPEILNGSPVTLSTDLWGLGCVLFELTTRRPVWHEHRHKSVPELLSIMKNHFHPKLPDVHWSLKPLYSVCWQVVPSKRWNVNDLHRLLTQY